VLFRFLFIFAFFISASFNQAWGRDRTIKIVTSIPPLASIAKELAGEKSDVRVLLSKKSDPHSFEIKGSDAKSLSRAELVLLVGDNYEPWAQGIEPKKIITVKESLDHLYTKMSYNNHYWVDPTAMFYFAQNLANRLSILRPQRAQAIQERLSIFEERIKSLDKNITAQVISWRYKKFISVHSVWGYFASRFGLDELGALRDPHGHELGARTFADIIKKTKTGPVKILFKEVHEPDSVLGSFVDDPGVRIVNLDALGDESEKYDEFILRNVAEMASKMKG
jgi:zinc transport system substrate-binding protein